LPIDCDVLAMSASLERRPAATGRSSGQSCINCTEATATVTAAGVSLTGGRLVGGVVGEVAGGGSEVRPGPVALGQLSARGAAPATCTGALDVGSVGSVVRGVEGSVEGGAAAIGASGPGLVCTAHAARRASATMTGVG